MTRRLTPSQADAVVILVERHLAGEPTYSSTTNDAEAGCAASGSLMALEELGLAEVTGTLVPKWRPTAAALELVEAKP